MNKNYVFFLGGYDLEMVRIHEIVKLEGYEFFDKNLSWGAKASSYAKEISEIANQGKIPVLIELEADIELPPFSVVIDHHGNRSNEKASLFQVMDLLGIMPGGTDVLIAANDSGYIPAMIGAGASPEWINIIRSADRKAQGVTEEMERQAEEAIAKSEKHNGLVIVRLPHDKCSSVSDRLFTSWPDGRENLLVACEVPGQTPEVNYFGRGDICESLKETFSGWGGGKGFGNPEGNGFAGCRTNDAQKVIEFVKAQYHK